MKKRAFVTATLFVFSLIVAAQVVRADDTAEAREIQTQSKLVFKRYENRYFLSQVWKAGSSRGRQLLKSHAEEEIARSARLETTGEVTLIARLSPAHR